MGDTSDDPIDHSRTTRKHAGEAMKNGFNAPGLLIVALAVVAVVVALASFATGNPMAGVAATAVAAAGFLAGGGWLFTAHRRVRKQELRWLAAGELDFPLPGSGRTGARWWKMAALAENDLVAGRLAEAHADAVAILAELGGPTPAKDQLWGVWAAEAPQAVVMVREEGGRILLAGTKAWCSGAGICTHALITGRRDDNARGLYAVDLSQAEVEPLKDDWQNVGMHDCDTRSVRLNGAEGIPVGRPGEYLSRPGFWHGAIGVAACWLGGARGVAGPLYRAVADEHEGSAGNVHAQAHLGAVDAALAAAEAMLVSAACYVDAEPTGERAELVARRVRAVVEVAVDEAITRTGRALGPGPLVSDAKHAQRVADLAIYVRQSHAERDLAVLGKEAAR